MTQLTKVTDHAVLRHLERVEGLNIESIRKFLAVQAVNDPRTRDKIDEFGGASYSIKKGEGVTYCMKGRSMTTCYPRKKKKFSKRRKNKEQKYPHLLFEMH